MLEAVEASLGGLKLRLPQRLLLDPYQAGWKQTASLEKP
jgi:hypothetical protein